MIRGPYYIVKKNKIENNKFLDIKNELSNITPWKDPNSKYSSQPFSIYRLGMKRKKIFLPRQYGCEKFGRPDSDSCIVSRGSKMIFSKSEKCPKCPIILRKDQRPAYKAIIKSYKNKDLGGIIVLPPGKGKTFISLFAARKIGRKTMIIVSQKNIAEQWLESIHKMNMTVKVISNYTIKEIKKNPEIIQNIIKNNDYIICVVKSLIIEGKFKMKMFNKIGFIIIDEIHSKISEKTLDMFTLLSSRYILALTATPKRVDNLHYLYSFYIGKIIYNYDYPIYDQKCNVHAYKYVPKKMEKIELIKNKNNDIDYIGTYKNMITNENRIKFIINLIKRYATISNKISQILVVDMLRSSLEKYSKELNKINIENTILYSGSNFNRNAKVILSIYNLSKQGLDIENCNCLILVMSLSTRKNIEGKQNDTIMNQIIGRIKRKKHKISPIIVDINHNFSFFKRHYSKRITYYKKKHYSIKHVKSKIN